MRIPIRYKTLSLITAVVLGTMAAYLYLATTLFTEDKLTSIYDVNAALSETLSEEATLYFGLLGDKLTFFGHEVMARGIHEEQREQLGKAFLDGEDELIQIEIYEREEGEFVPVFQKTRIDALDDLSVTLADLDETRQNWPIPFETLPAVDIFVRNNSLPPDAALLTVAIWVPARNGHPARAVVAEVKPSRLLRILGQSKIYTVYLVDGHGVVLVHPDPKLVVEKVSLRQRPVVETALEGRVRTGVQEFGVDDGSTVLASYTKVDVGGAVVLSEIPKEDALRAGKLLVRRSLLFGIALVMAAFVASVFFARALTRPIARLRIATLAAVKGDFEAPLPTKRGDEIGDLSLAFKELFSGLKRARHDAVAETRSEALAWAWKGAYDETRSLLEALKAGGAANPEITNRAQRQLELLGELNALESEDAAPAEFDVNPLVQRATERLGGILTGHGINLEVKLGSEVPTVRASAVRLQQIVTLLLFNAHRALEDGGQIRVTTFKDDVGRTVVAIGDDGPAIPEALHHKIFEPFFDDTTGRNTSTTALATVYQLVRSDKGIVFVEGGDGEHTSFQVCLPPA